MTNLYFEVIALLGDECQCGGDFLKCSTKDGGCCSEEAIGDMTGYCGGDTMRKLYSKIKFGDHKPKAAFSKIPPKEGRKDD